MKNSILITTITAMVVMASCAPTMYSPTVLNVPMLEEEGEVNIVASTNIDLGQVTNVPLSNLNKSMNNYGIGDQFDLNASYAITDKIGLQVNGTYNKPRDLDDEEYGSGYFGEFGVGYYKRLSKYFRFETYGLLGFGQVENHFTGKPSYGSSLDIGPGYRGDIKNYHIYADILRIGFQPSIALKHKVFFTSLAIRCSNINLLNVKGELIYDEQDWAKAFREDGMNNWIAEPAMTLGVNIHSFRFQVQGGVMLNFGKIPFNTEGGFGSVGIGYNLKSPKKE